MRQKTKVMHMFTWSFRASMQWLSSTFKLVIAPIQNSKIMGGKTVIFILPNNKQNTKNLLRAAEFI